MWKWKYNKSKCVNAAKAVLRRKFITLTAYIRKKGKISNQEIKGRNKTFSVCMWYDCLCRQSQGIYLKKKNNRWI